MNYLLLPNCCGADRGWKVNMMTVELWAKNLESEAFNSTSLYWAVYAGLLANCRAKQIDPDFTFEQVTDWVDAQYTTEAGKLLLEEIRVQFEASQYYIDMVKKLEGQLQEAAEESKKKEQEMTA